MKFAGILSVVACMSLADVVGAQVRIEWRRDVGEKVMRAVVRRDDSLRFPEYKSPHKNPKWLQGSIGTPAQEMGLTVAIAVSDVVVPELDSQLCNSNLTICGFYGTFAPGSSSTYEELDEEYKEATAGGLFNETGKYFKDHLRIGDVELNGLRMALANELHLDPSVQNLDNSHPFLELTPSLGIGPNSTVLKAMIEQGMIKSPGFSVWQENQQPSDCFKPAGADKCSPKSEYGTLLLGAIDKSKYEGDLISIDMKNEENGLDNWSAWISRIILDGVTVSTGADPSSFRSISQDSPVMVMYNMGPFSLLPEPMVSQIWDAFGVIAPAPNDGRGYLSQGRVPCDPAKRNKTSTGTIKLRFGGRCGPEVEVPFEDLVSAADDPDSAGAWMQPDDKGEDIPWCFFDIQKVGYISPQGKDEPPEIGAAFWKHMYMVYDFEHGKLAMAKKKKSDGKDDVVTFESKDASIPGALQYDVNNSTAECKSLAAGGESKDPDSSGDAFHPMKWGLELSHLAMALPFLF